MDKKIIIPGQSQANRKVQEQNIKNAAVNDYLVRLRFDLVSKFGFAKGKLFYDYILNKDASDSVYYHQAIVAHYYNSDRFHDIIEDDKIIEIVEFLKYGR